MEDLHIMECPDPEQQLKCHFPNVGLGNVGLGFLGCTDSTAKVTSISEFSHETERFKCCIIECFLVAHNIGVAQACQYSDLVERIQ